MAPARARLRWIAACSSLLLLAGGTDRAQAQGPSLVSLAKRGAESKARLLSDPARWEVNARTGTGVRYEMRVVSTLPDFEVRILVQPAGQRPHRFARVVSRRGKWYVDELGGVKGIYRPWEAPFSFEITALLLSEAWPRTYKLMEGHRFEKIDGAGMAFVRVPLVAAQRARAEAFLKVALKPGVKLDEEQERNLNEIRDRLAHGNLIRIDAANGLARSTTLGMMTLEYGAVEWLPRRPELPALRNLPDYAAPLPAKRDNLVMIGHYGAWKPGASRIDPGGRLLNLENGKLVRIPFVGGTCMPGCFVDDRSAVVVTGLDADGGHLGLYHIDLRTRKQRRLGGDLLATGQCHEPVLSPDGRRVAVLHRRAEEVSTVRRIYLVEIASGKAEQASHTFDGQSFSWLPEGKALVGVVRKPRVEGKGMENRVARFGLDGEVREILTETGPLVRVVGAKRDRLLFQDRALKWFTSDLEGGDRKLLGDGLARLGSPAVSPDGNRLLMIARNGNKGMTLVTVDLATGKSTPVKARAGWWSTPAWR